jgi:hypothetical protein
MTETDILIELFGDLGYTFVDEECYETTNKIKLKNNDLSIYFSFERKSEKVIYIEIAQYFNRMSSGILFSGSYYKFITEYAKKEYRNVILNNLLENKND